VAIPVAYLAFFRHAADHVSRERSRSYVALERGGGCRVEHAIGEAGRDDLRVIDGIAVDDEAASH